MNSKARHLEHYSKSLPPEEFQIFVSSADSGIDSDVSPVSSTKLSNFIEDIETNIIISPQNFILGKTAAEKDRINGINMAIDWIKEELVKIKLTDKQLAKAMITIRSKIAEHKLELDKIRDKGYDSDAEISGKHTEQDYVKETWKLIAKDGVFPADGIYFENNKRATWAV